MNDIIIGIIICVVCIGTIIGVVMYAEHNGNERQQTLEESNCEEITKHLDHYKKNNNYINEWIKKECWNV